MHIRVELEQNQKIPSSSPRSLLVISSALFFVLAPGVRVSRRIKGKKRIQKQQVLKNVKKKNSQKLEKGKIQHKKSRSELEKLKGCKLHTNINSKINQKIPAGTKISHVVTPQLS